MFPRIFRLTGVLGLFCLALAGPVRAQGEVRFLSVDISVWPEFDRSTALVIVDASLDPSVPLPAELTLGIPAASGGPFAVAVRDASGNLLNATYTTAPAGDRTLVNFATDAAGLRLEYYDPALSIDGQQRSYVLTWQADYAVQAVRLRVQQPSGAAGMTFEPVLSAAGVGDFGLNYFTGSLGALAAGQAVSVKMGYTKPDTRLTTDILGLDQAASEPATAPAAGSAGAAPANNPLLITGLVLSVALILGGLIIYLRNTRLVGRQAARAPAGGHKRRPRTQAGKPPAGGPAAFCAQCGQRVASGDRFCRGCGAPIRG